MPNNYRNPHFSVIVAVKKDKQLQNHLLSRFAYFRWGGEKSLYLILHLHETRIAAGLSGN